jgi:hypothetical protein
VARAVNNAKDAAFSDPSRAFRRVVDLGDFFFEMRLGVGFEEVAG